jgi:glucose 1-dehydrogenase
MELPLKGKVAVITGGSSGIGQGCALRFAEAGAKVVVASRGPADETLERIRAAGGHAMHIATDTADEEQCDRLCAQAVEAYGRVDVGVMAAGIPSVPEARREGVPPGQRGHVAHLTADNFRRMLDVNLTGVMLSARALVRQLLIQGEGGSIIMIASGASKMPMAGSAGYCIAKAGVLMLTKVMALELAETGIRVNAVAPGFTKTAMWNPAEDSPAYQWAMGITPMKRPGTPREQANACLFLASDEASFITGETIHVAGGQFVG